jgi:hypothetical protein
MKHKQSIPLRLIGVFAVGVAAPLFAQTNQLRIATAIEIDYVTEAGKSYMLQGSVDLQSWTDIGNPVLGNGQTVNQIFSTKDANINYASYRLSISPGPTNGYAPWTLAGVQLQMIDQTASNIVHYLNSNTGEDLYASGTDPFSYQYLRTSANDSQADRTYSPTRRDSVLYSFTGPGAGTWAREEYEQGVLKSRGIGAFHYLVSVPDPGTTNGVLLPPQSPAPPHSLTGSVYYVFTGAVPDKYQFNSTGNSGVATPGSTSTEAEAAPGGNVFTYTYSVLDTNNASLAINFGYYGIGGDRQEYDLTFTDGASGLFNRRIYRLGSLFATDHGAFSPNAVLSSPTNPNPPGDTNAPPTTPVGLTYTLNVSSTPIRLVFKTAAGGTEFDDSAPSEFSYVYQATGANTYSLHVQFKPDRWDDYDLTFSSAITGTAVRRAYKNSTLDRTDGGPFSVAPNP